MKPSPTLGAAAGPPASLGPASAWAPFLNNTGAPQWSKITVGGHSRASTFPALLSKFYPIERGVMWGGAGDYQRDAGAAARPAAWLSGPSLIDGANMYACDPALACDQFRMNYDALKMPVRHRDLSKQPNCAIAAVSVEQACYCAVLCRVVALCDSLPRLSC